MVTIQWKDTCIGWLLSMYALHICPIALQRPCIQWSKCILESHSENGPPPLKYVMLGSYWWPTEVCDHCWVPILMACTKRQKEEEGVHDLNPVINCHLLPAVSPMCSPTRHAGRHMNSNCTQSNHHNKIHSGRMKKHGLESWSRHGRRKSASATHCNPIKWRCSWENQQWKWRLHHQDFNIRWFNQQNMMNGDTLHQAHQGHISEPSTSTRIAERASKPLFRARRDHFNFERLGNLRDTSLIPSNNSQLVSKFGASPKLGKVPQNARSFLSMVDNYSLLLIEHGYQLSENEGYTPRSCHSFSQLLPIKIAQHSVLNPQVTRMFPIEMP